MEQLGRICLVRVELQRYPMMQPLMPTLQQKLLPFTLIQQQRVMLQVQTYFQ